MTGDGRYERKWEGVNASCDRLQVPGGWLVRAYAMQADRRVTQGGLAGSNPEIVTIGRDIGALGLVFVPDPNHAWRLEQLPKRLPDAAIRGKQPEGQGNGSGEHPET